MTRPSWYAVAYDVAGGIRAWSGPHYWSEARRRAERMERDRLVAFAHCTHRMFTLTVDLESR